MPATMISARSMKAPAQTSRVHSEPRTGVWPQQVVGAPDWWLERRRSAQDQLIKGGYGARCTP